MESTSPGLHPSVLAAKTRLVQGREKLRRQHDAGSPGVQVCTLLTDLLDEVVFDLYEAVLAELGGADGAFPKLALVAHGGFGRRDLAPFSDVDLMLLIEPRSEKVVEPLARRLSQSIFDAGLQLGFSVRTPRQACQLAAGDATICTTLTQSRFLAGSVRLFKRFAAAFARDVARRRRSLIAAIEAARRDEWHQHGGTVNLLEPNVKRSLGGLRDIQLVRWIGFIRFGQHEIDQLHRAGHLSPLDYQRLRDARDFLLRLRNEMHFEAGKAHDLLDRHEQVRVAEKFGYVQEGALLAVERFMRDYFAHTTEVRNIAQHFLASARPRVKLLGLLHPLVSHQVERDFRVGPVNITATQRGLKKVTGELDQVLRLLNLATLYSKRIDDGTWEAIRQAMTQRADLPITDETIERFLDLMAQPGQLDERLRALHELRVLEKIIPAMSHARCLLQFNEYHKYTVDEHSLRAIRAVTQLLHDQGPLGEAYRGLSQKRTLHLAVLLHDLGKGFVEDHSELGRKIAAETGARLGLPMRERQILEFLVHKHLAMAHLAFRRDLHDEQVVVRFAVEVGSPEVLRMLYLLTAADVTAVGPGVWNQWKAELLTELYRRTMRHLAGDAPGGNASDVIVRRRSELEALASRNGDHPWWQKQIAALPGWYLVDGPPARMHEQLNRLRDLPHREAVAWGRYDAERNAVEYTIGTYEEITPGIFHKLTGALTSKGLQILSASIATLAEGMVLDRFYVTDGDFSGPPPAERIDEVCAALVAALEDDSGRPPTFRRVWKPASAARPAAGSEPVEVKIDNSTAERYTILDIFAHDRMGLLYTITRTIFELGLSVHVAKIGTYRDQVLDVFYVTDEAGRKINNESRLGEIRARLLEAIGPD